MESKIKGLEKDKENSKKTASNNTKIKLMNVTSTYYDKVAKALKCMKCEHFEYH
jgi:hypothetical protein